MAKFLFPTGRKSYFMDVIPLSRIQRLAVGNRGGWEGGLPAGGRGFLPARRWGPAGCLPALGSHRCHVAERREVERQKGRAST